MNKISLSPASACRLLAVSAGLLIVFSGKQALWALQVPQMNGRVNDYADMLSVQTRLGLDHMLADLERTDGTQMMVLTITSLEGDNLEDFAFRVFNQWAIGRSGLDNGVLLLIARNDRKMRIEVGYGLEAFLTDLQCGRIIGNTIAPEFKQGHFDRGVMQGASKIVQTLRGQNQAGNDFSSENHLTRKCLTGIAICIMLIIVLLKDTFFSPAAASALFACFAGVALFDLSIIHLSGLAAFVFIAVSALSLVRRKFKPKDRYAVYSLDWRDDDRRRGSSTGGFSSGGGSSGSGGASGGGGGSGGGGASGGW